MTNRFFFDCEFLEDGRTIDLISIGIVAQDGREYYAVVSETETDTTLYDRIVRHDWLMANVVPHLPQAPRLDHLPQIVQPERTTAKPGRFSLDRQHPAVLPRWVVAKQVREFLLAGNPERDWRQTELWAYYGAYDHVALAQLWGPMIRLPKGIPMWTNDIMQAAAGRELPEQPAGLHNVLEDARHVRTMWEHLQ